MENLTRKRASRGGGDWKPRFLRVLGATANVRAACKSAGIARAYAYEARSKDEAFAALWDAAVEDATDDLEAEARKRAKQASDALLMFLLKAHRPEKFRERYTAELVGAGGGPVQIQHIEVIPPHAARALPEDA